MNLKEIIVTVLYLLIFSVVAYVLRPYLTDKNTKKYFLPALWLKLIGGVCVGLIYYFYYGGGDTVSYFDHGAHHIYRAFLDSPLKALKIIFLENIRVGETIEYTAPIWVYRDSASFMTVRFAGFFNLFAFDTYGGTVCWFSFISFLTVWKLYRTVYLRYKDLHFKLALACFFLPSVFFWGSGILKDTITFSAVCLMVSSALEILFLKRKIIKNILIILAAAFAIYSIKIYILIALIPSLAYLFLFQPIANIKNKGIRLFITPVLFTILAIGSYFGMKVIGENSPRYNLENMAYTAQETAKWIHYVSKTEGGAGYTLGDYDFSAFGVVKKTLPAIWVTLFRPHPWEVKNPVMLLSAIEALFFIYLLFNFILKTKIGKIRHILSQDSMIISFLLFAFIFSWAVGLTTYNFGSLVRYKIPMMPFFVMALYLAQYHSNKLRNKA